ncbi:MAG: rhomboid family intramembrane serine protease, partial [Verrucomicrobiota bacterium]
FGAEQFDFPIDKGKALGYSRGMSLSGRKVSSFTRRWTQQQRVVLVALISTNVAVFIAQLLLQNYDTDFVRTYLALSDRGINDAYAWQFLSAMFLHSGPWHLLGNMLVLYFLGRDLESILGQRHFLYLYLAGAIGGELGHLFLMPAETMLLAASGGVAAILVAYATILPELELTSMIFFVVPLRLKAKHLVYGVAATSLVLLFLDRSGTVIHSAWIGGCAVGWIYAHLLGFGRPSLVQRFLQQRRFEVERLQRMSSEQFIAEEIDPLLEKISLAGIDSLTRGERRKLARAREKIAGPASAE